MGRTDDHAERLMAFLRKNRDDRGLMADLRCGFSPGREHRAWPHIASFCDMEKDWSRIPVQTVCAAFATHPKSADSGNLGTTMRAIAKGDANNRDAQKALSSFEGRFRRLLGCATVQELCIRLPAVIRAAKAREVPVNYRRLYADICWWEKGEKKIQWASAYWGAGGAE